MHLHEVEDRTGVSKELLRSEIGTLPVSLGIMPGTGWKEGLESRFQLSAEVPYDRLNLPGMRVDHAGKAVPGHKNLCKWEHWKVVKR